MPIITPGLTELEWKANKNTRRAIFYFLNFDHMKTHRIKIEFSILIIGIITFFLNQSLWSQDTIIWPTLEVEIYEDTLYQGDSTFVSFLVENAEPGDTLITEVIDTTGVVLFEPTVYILERSGTHTITQNIQATGPGSYVIKGEIKAVGRKVKPGPAPFPKPPAGNTFKPTEEDPFDSEEAKRAFEEVLAWGTALTEKDYRNYLELYPELSEFFEKKDGKHHLKPGVKAWYEGYSKSKETNEESIAGLPAEYAKLKKEGGDLYQSYVDGIIKIFSTRGMPKAEFDEFIKQFPWMSEYLQSAVRNGVRVYFPIPEKGSPWLGPVFHKIDETKLVRGDEEELKKLLGLHEKYLKFTYETKIKPIEDKKRAYAAALEQLHSNEWAKRIKEKRDKGEVVTRAEYQKLTSAYQRLDEEHKRTELFPKGKFTTYLEGLKRQRDGNWSVHSDCECFELEVYKSFEHRLNRIIIPKGIGHSRANPDEVTGALATFLGLYGKAKWQRGLHTLPNGKNCCDHWNEIGDFTNKDGKTEKRTVGGMVYIGIKIQRIADIKAGRYGTNDYPVYNEDVNFAGFRLPPPSSEQIHRFSEWGAYDDAYKRNRFPFKFSWVHGGTNLWVSSTTESAGFSSGFYRPAGALVPWGYDPKNHYHLGKAKVELWVEGDLCESKTRYLEFKLR